MKLLFAAVFTVLSIAPAAMSTADAEAPVLRGSAADEDQEIAKRVAAFKPKIPCCPSSHPDCTSSVTTASAK